MTSYQIENRSISEMEVEVQQFWKQAEVFRRSVENRPKENPWVLYDGPPFATGLPHYGHILAGSIKDVGPRFETMRGKRVERRFGWDCHGVPIEHQVQKEQNLSHDAIQKEGIAAFNERCRAIVLRYTNEWRKSVERLGRFVDMDNDYKTMDSWYMESVWAVFKRMFDKGYVYEGTKVVAYSTALATPLSNFEAGLNYKENTQDPEIVIAFPLVEEPNTALLVWTTTPWTVPSNVAIALNANFDYVKVTLLSGKNYILLKDAVSKYFKDPEQIVAQVKISAKDLLGKSYLPMFPCLNEEERSKSYKVLEADFVTSDAGTGFVHIAPAFGEDDSKLGQKHSLPAKDFFDVKGCFAQGLPDHGETPTPAYDGLNRNIKGVGFKEADKALIRYMKQQGRVIHHATCSHSYPFCWRTDTPLMYRAVPSWYIDTPAMKDRLLANNAAINWSPEFVGKARFKDWLENVVPWSISRNRFWGCPIPIWRNVDDPNDIIVISSIEELKRLTGEQEISDLHSHKIDHLVVQKEGKTYKRIPEVFDCWFESGAMPYAQVHFPFEGGDEEFLKASFPADFIAEGIDQTRGWFYTLLVIGTALFDRSPFKNCVVNGIVLGNDGQKMSKSKGNYQPVDEVFEKYGADALRFVLLGSPAVNAEQVAITENLLQNTVKNLLLPISNIYKFFAQEANDQNLYFKSSQINRTLLINPLDKWLVYRVEKFKAAMTTRLEKFDYQSTCKEIQAFVDELSKWYVRNIKTSLRDKDYPAKSESLQCLLYALETLSKCAAPIIPFMSDYVYRQLFGMEFSVHLQDWPSLSPAPELELNFQELEIVRQIIALGNRTRNDNRLPVKQPLSTMYLGKELQETLRPYEDIILTTLNVEKIEWVDSVSGMLDFEVVLDLKVLGPKYKAELPALRTAVQLKNYTLDKTGSTLHIIGKELTVAAGEFSVRSLPKVNVCGANEGDLWVVINKEMTPELVERGQLRNLIRHIQAMRKELGLSRSDELKVAVEGQGAEIAEKHKQEIRDRAGTEVVAKPTDKMPDLERVIDEDDESSPRIFAYRAQPIKPSSRSTLAPDFSY